MNILFFHQQCQAFIYKKNYFNQEVSTNTNVGYKIIPYGYITYRSMSDTNIFHFNVQNIVEKGIVSPAYPVFFVNSDILDNYFLIFQMNNCNKFFKQLVSSKEGGTRYALSFKKLSILSVAIPKKKEQLKISKLIIELDNLITLHQREYYFNKDLKEISLLSLHLYFLILE